MKIESVYYEITNICNLNCKTCYNRSGQNKKLVELPIESIFASINMFRRYGVKSIHLSGGEPMLYTDIGPLFDGVRRHPDLPFMLSTNCTVKLDYLVESYKTLSNLFLQISLDGASEKTNQRTRGVDNFKYPIRVLSALCKSNRPIGYRLKMVISRYNIDDIPNYYELAREFKCEPKFSFMSPIGNGASNKTEMSLSAEEKMMALRYIDDCNKKYNMNIQLPFCAFSCPFSKDEEDITLSCMVKSNGDIMPCQSLYDEKYKLSNIYSFDEEALRQNLNYLKRAVEARELKDYNCKSCIINPICKRGCPAMALLNSGDILGNDEECSFRLKHYLKYQFRT